MNRQEHIEWNLHAKKVNETFERIKRNLLEVFPDASRIDLEVDTSEGIVRSNLHSSVTEEEMSAWVEQLTK